VWSYILRRTVAGLIVLLVVSFVVFFLVALSGNPLATLMANPRVSHATIQAARVSLHLNQPILERYWNWLLGLLHGSFGTSFLGQSVGSQLGQRLLVTLRLTIPVVIISVILAVVVGVIGAVRQYHAVDYVSTGMSYIFFATPVFILALLLKDFLAVDVNQWAGHTILYTVGPESPGFTGNVWQTFVNSAQHIVLPVLTLVLVTYASWSRFQRASLLDVLNADYIRLARAKGLSPRRVLYVHALRNALIPVTTVVALDFAGLLGGVVITEIVYSWNGMGTLFYNALAGGNGGISPDVYIVQGWLMVAAAAVIVFNIIADVMYAFLDPRIRYA
jgi:peptide/nickel transport system permease protein